MASISWTDSVGAAEFSNLKPSGGSRFDNWTPDAEVIGPTATGLGTGSLHVFEFRTDYIVGLEISKVPATDEVYEKMLRLKLHLERGGEVTLSGSHVLLEARYTTCSLAPDTKPTINFSDRTCLEYTFGVVLRGVGSGVGEPEPEVLTPEEIAELDECSIIWHWQQDSLVSLGLSNDDPIALWPDVGGKNHYGYQLGGETAGRPVFRAEAFGTLPGVEFMGTYGQAHFFRIFGLELETLTGATIVAVLRTEFDPQTEDWDVGLWDFRNGVGFMAQSKYPSTDGVIHESFGRDGDLFTVGHPPGDGLVNPHIYSVTSIDGEITAKHNGELTQTSDTNTFYPSGFGLTSRIGTSTPDAMVVNFRGWIAEVWCLDCKPSIEAESYYIDYLRSKYPVIDNAMIGRSRGMTLWPREFENVSDGGSQSDTIVQPVPDNTVVPNLLLWAVHIGSELASVPWPVGWTELQRVTSSNDGATLAVAYKGASSSEPASYTMTLDDPEWFVSTMVRVVSELRRGLGDIPPILGTSVPTITGSGQTDPSDLADDPIASPWDFPASGAGGVESYDLIVFFCAVDNETSQTGIDYGSNVQSTIPLGEVYLSAENTNWCSMAMSFAPPGSYNPGDGWMTATGTGVAGRLTVVIGLHDPENIYT
jgi:hypothetical protein